MLVANVDTHQLSHWVTTTLISSIPPTPTTPHTARRALSGTTPVFHLFEDVTEWANQTREVLVALPSLLEHLKIDRAHGIVCDVMALVAGYLRLHLALATLDGLKGTLIVHCWAVRASRGHAEAAALLAQVGRTLPKYEQPTGVMRVVAEELQPLAEMVGVMMVEFRDTILLSLDPDKMRQRNVLHPMDEGLAMVLPTHAPLSQRAPSVPLHDELLHADDYVQWVVFATFACPATLARPDIFQMFQQAS